jgi:hypothetical protein
VLKPAVQQLMQHLLSVVAMVAIGIWGFPWLQTRAEPAYRFNIAAAWWLAAVEISSAADVDSST